MLFFGIAMVVCALVLYTAAVWGHVLSGKLYSWMVASFGIGFFFDVMGTVAMASLQSGFAWSMHGVIGWAALMLMGGTLVALTLAYYEQGRTEYLMRRCAAFIWGLWLLSFASPWF